jgi:hypothetical protein
MNQSYSKLTVNIREKISAPTVDVAEITYLIKQSHECVSMRPTEISKRLHNKLLEILLNQHPIPEFQDLLADYYWPSTTVDELEHQFNLEPSNFSVVFQLAVEYAELGKHKRAKQFLRRVARSGYKEKESAMTFLKEQYGEGL